MTAHGGMPDNIDGQEGRPPRRSRRQEVELRWCQDLAEIGRRDGLVLAE